MTNLGWIRCRTCSTGTGSSFNMISVGTYSNSRNGVSNLSNVYGNNFIRKSYFRNYYRPWFNYNHHSGTYPHNKQQQIAQFCKKAKKIKESALVTTADKSTVSPSTTGTTAANSSSTTASNSSLPPKNLRRKKKDISGTSSANHSEDTRILVPLSKQNSIIRSSPPSTKTSTNRSQNGAASTTTKASGATAELSSTATTNTTAADVRMTSVYVHPLSQMVLQYLQTNCHDWVQSKNLQYLKIQGDGTFCVESAAGTTPPHRPPTTPIPTAIRHHTSQGIKIWTTYEKEERKHWLCVSVVLDHQNVNLRQTSSRSHPFADEQSLWQNRYMLQDNNNTPWQNYSQTPRGAGTPERIQSHVHELIQAVDTAMDGTRKKSM